MTRYAIVIEKGDNNYSAYAPDVLGCGVTGQTIDEVRATLAEALASHFELLRESGESIPEAISIADYVEVL